MVTWVAFLISLTVVVLVFAEEKSHEIWITRMEESTANPKYIVNMANKLNKVNKNRKSVDVNYTMLQEINEDNLICQVKIFQKTGGKFVKAPIDVPPTPCCTLMKNKGLVWRCIREKSNMPESCPVPAGDYHLKDFDPYFCEYPKNLPPSMPEEYKVEFIGTLGPEQVFRHAGYGVIKKKMQLL